LRGLPTQLKQRIEQLLGPPAGARVWVSATPLVLPRHLKPRGKNSLLGQVNAELASRGLAAAERVEILEERTKELRHYVRHRQHGGAPPPIGLGFALRLEFAEPICGPLTLGYA